jgi:hypothetical protein
MVFISQLITETWTRLPNSNQGIGNFDARKTGSKVVVNPVNGDVYFGGMDGVFVLRMRVQWNIVLSSGGLALVLVTLLIWSSLLQEEYTLLSGRSAGPTDMPGVWTSTTGNAGSWTKLPVRSSTESHRLECR